MTQGERLRKWRENHDLTQVQAVERANQLQGVSLPAISQGTWSKLESGDASPSLEQAALIERLTKNAVRILGWVAGDRRKAG
jgi:transcriptional regulator with XRE-family HTH domain